jgi:hypothetical protein
MMSSPPQIQVANLEPIFRICKVKKIQMLQIGGRFGSVLADSSKTFLSLQE